MPVYWWLPDQSQTPFMNQQSYPKIYFVIKPALAKKWKKKCRKKKYSCSRFSRVIPKETITVFKIKWSDSPGGLNVPIISRNGCGYASRENSQLKAKR
jgi:hypothetical protein